MRATHSNLSEDQSLQKGLRAFFNIWLTDSKIRMLRLNHGQRCKIKTIKNNLDPLRKRLNKQQSNVKQKMNKLPRIKM